MAEAAALQPVRRPELGSGFDGVLLVPAFLEAGRLTAAGIHRARIGPDLVPAGQTGFARDPVSGYTASGLTDFIGCKSGGTTGRGDLAITGLAGTGDGMLSVGMFGRCAALICTCAGFLTVTRTMPSAGTGSQSRRGWPASRFTAAGRSAPSRPAGRPARRVYVRIPDMDPRSLEMALRIACVFGVRPGDAFRYPDSPEVAA
jgi:hypothetical protein